MVCRTMTALAPAIAGVEDCFGFVRGDSQDPEDSRRGITSHLRSGGKMLEGSRFLQTFEESAAAEELPCFALRQGESHHEAIKSGHASVRFGKNELKKS